MKSFIMLIVVLLSAAVGAFSFDEVAKLARVLHYNSQNRAHNLRRSVELTTRVVNQSYCTKIGTHSPLETQLRLKLKLSLRNISNETLIIDRFSNPIYTVVLSQSLAKAKAGRYAYDAHSSLMRLSGFYNREFKESSPTNEFIILKPNESLDYEYDQEIEIALTAPGDPGWRLRSRKYFLQIRIQTWSWEIKKAEQLEQLWAMFGKLWYYDVKSEPMSIEIENPNSITASCK